MTIQSVLQVAVAGLTRYVMDAGLAGDRRFLWFGAALLATLFLMVALRGVLLWTTGRIADCSAARLRHTLLNAAEHSSGERLQEFHSGSILNRGIEDVKVLCDGMIGLLPTLLGSLTQLVGAFVLLAVFYPPLAGILGAVCGAVGVGIICLRPVLRQKHRRVRETEEREFSGMQMYTQQLELIQALGAEEETLRRFQGLLDESLDAKRRRRKWSVTSGTALSLLTQIGTGCLLLWGAHAIYSGTLSYGGLTAVLQLLALFRSPVLGLSGQWSRMMAIEVSGERLKELLTMDKVSAGEEGPQPEAGLATAVVFENVTFRYQPSEQPVLEHYSARFDLREWTCLTGVSGLGKTTLFKLILGIYRPQSGRVYLETEHGAQLCGTSTRQLFAYVPQDISLFSGSVLENLRLVDPEADEQKCRRALETAQAHFVYELSAGVETQVKDQRSGLSMGQLQRIAIARAVLSGRPILLLDECTSALDQETELAVLRALRSLGKGAVLVTHHPEALKDIDHMWSMDMEGKE